MELVVQTTSGSTFSILTHKFARVLDIKKEIEKSLGIDVSTQDLYHKGEALLLNDLRLEQCNIVHHSRLLLVLPVYVNYRVLPPAPSNYITNIEDSLGKNQGCPAMATSNKRQMLHQTEHSQVPPSNTIEAFDNQGWSPMAKSNDDQMLHQTKQSLVPSNEAEEFFKKDWSAMARSKEDQMLHQPEKSTLNSFSFDELLEIFPQRPSTDQDMRKTQGFWPASTNEGNVNIQESSGRNDDYQDLLQREPYSVLNTFGNFSFGEDLSLSTDCFTNSQCYWPVGTSEEIINKNQVSQTEQYTVPSNTFGDVSFSEDRSLSTDRFTNSQSYLPMSTTGDIFINKDQVFPMEQSTVSSNTFGDFSFSEDRSLSTDRFTNSQSYLPMGTTGDIFINKNQVFPMEQSTVSSNTFGDFWFGEDGRESTEHFANSQSYLPVNTTGDIFIKKDQVFPMEQSTVSSNSTEQRISTQDFPVRLGSRNQVVQTEKSQPIRAVINWSELEDEAGTGASATHPIPEEAHHPNQVNEAPPLAQEALPHNALSVDELHYQLYNFTASFSGRTMGTRYITKLNARLGVYDSTPERRRQIKEGMRLISALQGKERPSSGRKAGDDLVDFIREWDQKQVLQTEKSTVPSNSTEKITKTPDLPVRVRSRNQKVQTEKSQPIREVRSLKIPRQKQRVTVLPYSREKKPVSKFPVNMNASENFEELRKELEKIEQMTQLPSSNQRELEEKAGTWASFPHPNQVSEAPPFNAPSVLELHYQLFQFASSFNRISMRCDYLQGIYERLGVDNSTPERRRQILEGMRLISSLQWHERPDSGGKACEALVDFIRKWDQQQD